MKKNELEVIKVKHKDGFMLINKQDYDEKKYELYKENEVKLKDKEVKKKDK